MIHVQRMTVNKLLTRDIVEKILNYYGNIGDNGGRLEIYDLNVYQTAFVHQSFLAHGDKDLDYVPSDSFERLETVGDSFVGAVVVTYLFNRFPTEREGFLTQTRSKLVKTKALYRFARILGLGDYLLLNPQMEKLSSTSPDKGRNNPRNYEDIFESFVGAIIVDFGDEDGYRYAKRFLVNLMENCIDFADLIMCNDNHKDTLQRYFQSLKFPNPVYDDLDDADLQRRLRKFTKGVFLKQEYINALPERMIKDIRRFHEDTIRTTLPCISRNITKIAQTRDALLLGIGHESKKSVAEQNCSKQALICIGIDLNW